MKRVLYMNLLYNNYGQRRMDENIIRELSKIAEVYVVCPKSWYEHEIRGAKYIYFETSSRIHNSQFNEYDRNLKNIVFANKLRKKIRFDIYVFASYDTVVFPIWMAIARTTLKRCFIIQNNNIDGVINSRKKLKRWIFNLYSTKVNHIVLEGFIGDFLTSEFIIPVEHVFLLPHPLNSNKNITDKMYECVGISNSNDDDWIQEIIDLEEQKKIFEKNKCKVALRSKKHSFDNGWLTIINGWLDDNAYNAYIDNAKCIFLPYPKSFKYRMSGSVVDAFSNHTSVLGSSIPLFSYYSKRYVGICKIVETPEDFFNVVVSQSGKDTISSGFDRFIIEHSDEVVLQSLEHMINAV